MTSNGRHLGQDGDAMDPLDAFMASLNAGAHAVESSAPLTTVDARAAARAYRNLQSSTDAEAHVATRNRRYKRLQQLLQQPATTDNASNDEWYFSDESMQQRNPAMFHLHLGQYLNVASRQQRVPLGDDGVTLSTFLMETCERQVLEARRIQEQQTWGDYRSIDDTADAEDDEEEEEEETKSGEQDEESVAARRAQLIELMSQRFLDGCDINDVDYAAIDADEALDDLDQMQRDAEERYFALDD